MAKAPAATVTEPSTSEPAATDAEVTAASGPHETPGDTSEGLGLVPADSEFVTPDPVKLSKGEVEGLGREALEAYWYGQRVRHDAGGRRWDFRREAVNHDWSLVIRVQVGPVLLAKGAITLDRLPSADGERDLLALVELLAVKAFETQADVVKAQKRG